MRGVKGGSEEMIEDVPSFITIVSGGDILLDERDC